LPRKGRNVERLHRSDQQERGQLIGDKDDVDLATNFQEWGRIYDLSRPHGDYGGKAPYEALREKL
jgi:hypothetical protein